MKSLKNILNERADTFSTSPDTFKGAIRFTSKDNIVHKFKKEFSGSVHRMVIKGGDEYELWIPMGTESEAKDILEDKFKVNNIEYGPMISVMQTKKERMER